MVTPDSPVNISVAVINAVVSITTLIFTGMMAYFTARLNTKADSAAVKVDDAAIRVEQVKQRLVTNKVDLETYQQTSENKLNEIQKTGRDIHTLVNSNMSTQLRITMLLARRVASLTGQKTDIDTYNEAKKLYEDHVKSQQIIDKRDAEKNQQTKP